MAFTLLAPSFFLVCYLAVIHVNDFTWLAIMAVALPRLFQILSYSYEMLFILADFPMYKSRLKTVMELLEPSHKGESNHRQLEKRIRWDAINVDSNKVSLSSRDLLGALPKSGRFTLQGENGSGKTSLLLLLKLNKGESAFYLPAKHQLMFQVSHTSLSTGQLATSTLKELLEKLDSPIVLLDEWDANLDKRNTQSLSQLIEKLSLKKCVIESRHLRQH
ncbi:hypothetical protein COB11_07400 [Candidatus Aerophobetes bacterium]|uniref:Uncharacterized protein n=1 Tax=Aerophobetes bacterium TaxID=2030807 RepID=A0A2A4YCB9_UNCAE|nr:MAG: hypothetical protein COB11_07400 [Candidatus Aerophobetes bacterium]